MTRSTKWYINTMKYCLAIRWNKLWIHSNLEEFEMSYAKQKETHSKALCCTPYFSRKDKIIGIENKSVVVKIQGGFDYKGTA